MIDVDLAPGRKGRLLIRFQNASQLALQSIQSLLSCRYSERHNGFFISVEDFIFFKEKLNAVQAPDEGFISEEADDFIINFLERKDYLIQLKKKEITQEDWTDLWENTLQKNGAKTKPYEDQLQCIRFHAIRKKSLEGGETGIGKTLILLYSFLYWKNQYPQIKGLILCVNSGKLGWESEILQHTNIHALTIGNGSKECIDGLRKFKHDNYDLLICHYDCLYQDSRSKVRVFDHIQKLNFGFVALDEVHTLKNPHSKRFKRVSALIDQWGDIPLIAATGTCMDGNPKSAWAPIKIVESKPNFYFPSYSEWSNYFVEMQPRFFGRYRKRVMVEAGFKNLRRLKEYLDYTCIRFMKSEVSLRPPKIFQTRIVQLSGAQLQLYNQIKKAISDEIKTDDGDLISLTGIASRTLRLRQILNHPTLIDGVMHFSGDSAKYIELDDVLEEILSHPESQVLVWTQWRSAVEMLVKRYKEYGAIALYGGSDDRLVRDKVLSKKARVVIAVPEKAATSIDWLKVCRTAIYLEKPWYLTLYRQSLDRIDRRTNTDPALIISIEAAQSVDQLVNAVLKRRQDVFDAVSVDDEKLIALGKEDILGYLR